MSQGFDEDTLRAMRAAPDVVFTAVIENVHEAAELRLLANAYEQVGLPAFAEGLRRRATLRELTDEAREELRKMFLLALLSDDPVEMRTVGAQLERQGAVHSARVLYETASGLPEKS